MNGGEGRKRVLLISVSCLKLCFSYFDECHKDLNDYLSATAIFKKIKNSNLTSPNKEDKHNLISLN